VQLAGRLLRCVREGAALSAALREESSIPQAFVGVVQGGEQAGQLGASLASLAASLQRQAETRERIRSALAYPMAVLVVALVAVLFVLTAVIPEFSPLFIGEERRLPLVTRAVLHLSAMVTGRLPFIAAGSVALVALAWLAWRRSAGLRQRVWAAALRLAPVRHALRLDLAQATRVLGTLLESGLEASQAMQLAGHSAAFTDLRLAFGHAARQLREGASLARAYAALPHLPQAAATLLAVGERSGQAGAAALRAAQLIESDTNRRIDRLLATLNPVAVISLGALVGLLIAAIMLGILSINQLALR
jgi:type II secretory pathway component PulF